MMTNLEHFKRTITVENLCDKLNCLECPMFQTSRDYKKPCFKRLKDENKKLKCLALHLFSTIAVDENGTIPKAWNIYKQSQHSLWIARATILKGCWKYQFNFLKDKPMEKEDIAKWQWAEHKCREKAKEFE